MAEQTPVTDYGLRRLDHLPVSEALALAWHDPGLHVRHHRAMQRQVREQMPVLARALDRLPDPREEFENGI